MMKNVLFLCTGNYYRSRLAHEYFNYWCAKLALPYQADSRALSQALEGNGNKGNIATEVVQILTGLEIPCHSQHRPPLSVTADDFANAELIIAMDKDEHLPMVSQDYVAVKDKVNYLNVGDVHVEPVYVAVPKLIKQVDHLISTLA